MRWGVADIDYGIGGVTFGEIVPIKSNIAPIFSTALTFELASGDNITTNVADVLQVSFTSSDVLQIGISDVAEIMYYIDVVASIAPQILDTTQEEYILLHTDDLLQSNLATSPYIEANLSSQKTITINMSNIIGEMETKLIEDLLVSIADSQMQRDLFTDTLLHVVLDSDTMAVALVDTIIKRFDGIDWIAISPCVHIKQSDGTWQQIIVTTKQHDGSWI